MHLDSKILQNEGWLTNILSTDSMLIWEEIYPQSFFYTSVLTPKDIPLHIVKVTAPSDKVGGIKYLEFVRDRCTKGKVNNLLMCECFKGYLTRENPNIWFTLKAVKELAKALKGGDEEISGKPIVITLGPNPKIIQKLIAYSLGLKPVGFVEKSLAEEYIRKKFC